MRLLAAAAAAALLARARAEVAIPSGCLCLTACERTIDSPFVPWCVTSRKQTANATDACGSTWSTSRAAYWSPCAVNATSAADGAAAGPSRPLTTFFAMWSYICSAAVAGVAAPYAAAGLFAAARGARAPLKALLWVPAAAALAGAAHGLLVGAPLAALLALLYLSLPYAIDATVAVALGLAIAALAVFVAVGRDGTPAAHEAAD